MGSNRTSHFIGLLNVKLVSSYHKLIEEQFKVLIVEEYDIPNWLTKGPTVLFLKDK